MLSLALGAEDLRFFVRTGAIWNQSLRTQRIFKFERLLNDLMNFFSVKTVA